MARVVVVRFIVSPDSQGIILDKSYPKADKCQYRKSQASNGAPNLSWVTKNSLPVSRHASLYRNAATLSLGITLLCYVIYMALGFSGYSGPPLVNRILTVPYVIVFPGGQAMSWLCRVIPANGEVAFFVLFPLCSFIINTAVGLFIAFVIARLRDRRFTQPLLNPSGQEAK